MIRLFNTVAFRLAMGYGILVLCAVAVISAILYLGTVEVMDREINAKIFGVSDRLIKRFAEHGLEGVQQGIDQFLTDGVDSDTEVYFLVGPDGKRSSATSIRWPAIRCNWINWLMNRSSATAGYRAAASSLTNLRMARFWW